MKKIDYSFISSIFSWIQLYIFSLTIDSGRRPSEASADKVYTLSKRGQREAPRQPGAQVRERNRAGHIPAAGQDWHVFTLV